MGRRKTRPGEASRADLEHPVALRYKHLDDFVDELAANVSTGGMFIRTARPHPAGSVFEFELRPESDRPHISGKAQVAWVRRPSNRGGRPPGMGVRFVELDDASRRSIALLVATQRQAGGEPVDLEPAADDPVVAAPSVSPDQQPPERAGGSAPSQSSATAPPPALGRAASAEPRRLPRLAWPLAALLLAAIFLVALWPRPVAEPPSGEPSPPPPVASEPAAGGSGSGTGTGTGAPADDRPVAPAAEASPPAPARAVEAWARAWSEQRVEEYLAAYSPRFVPGGGLDRSAWERQRRARILAPDRIEVRLAFVEIEEIDAGRGRVRFVQAYDSDSYSDVVRKVLELERGADGWKIVRETVEP